jgi:hypothetical protein
LGFITSGQIRHDDSPNRVRHDPTDWSFTSRCSPPRLAATQLRSVTKFRPTLTRTFTSLIRNTYMRTHRWACPSGALTGQLPSGPWKFRPPLGLPQWRHDFVATTEREVAQLTVAVAEKVTAPLGRAQRLRGGLSTRCSCPVSARPGQARPWRPFFWDSHWASRSQLAYRNKSALKR